MPITVVCHNLGVADSGEEGTAADDAPGDTASLQLLCEAVPATDETDILGDDAEARLRALAHDIPGQDPAPSTDEPLERWLASRLGATVIARSCCDEDG